MPITDTITSFLKMSTWRKSKREKPRKKRPRSIVDVTDVIRNIDGQATSYHSFDVDFQYPCEITTKDREKAKKSRKSENRKSWMSLMCGMDKHDFCSSSDEILKEERPTIENAISKEDNLNQEHPLINLHLPGNESPICTHMSARVEEKENSSTKRPKSEKRKSWMSLMCGAKHLDFENEFDILPKVEESQKHCSKQENRKSLMSLMCVSENTENKFRKSVYRDSGISLLSEEFVVPKMEVREKYQSKSCNDLLESLRHCDENFGAKMDESLDNNSMNNLFRTTSIQENSLQIMRRRHRNVKRRRERNCDSCYSSYDFKTILAGSKSENDLTSPDSFIEQEVRFSGVDETCKGKSVSTTDVGRYNSRELKSWQIRRQRRDQKNKEKRESRNLELLLSKDFEFQERLIV